MATITTTKLGELLQHWQESESDPVHAVGSLLAASKPVDEEQVKKTRTKIQKLLRSAQQGSHGWGQAEVAELKTINDGLAGLLRVYPAGEMPTLVDFRKQLSSQKDAQGRRYISSGKPILHFDLTGAMGRVAATAATTSDENRTTAGKGRGDISITQSGDTVSVNVNDIGSLYDWIVALTQSGSDGNKLAKIVMEDLGYSWAGAAQNPKGGSHAKGAAGRSGVQTSELTVVRLDAGHDRNGNPRRLYLILSQQDGIAAAVDEEYYGRKALSRAFGPGIGRRLESKADKGGTVATTPREYRSLLEAFPSSAPHFPTSVFGDDTVMLHMDAGHDANGNPRRLFLVFRGGESVNAIDEEYLGAPKDLDYYVVARIATTPAEYRNLLRTFKDVPSARKNPSRSELSKAVRTEMEQGSRWFRSLGPSDKWDLGDQFVMGSFDWRDWFEQKPTAAFLAGADQERINWEIMSNPSKRGLHVIGTTGDVNMFDYDAGVVYSDEYGTHWEWWYWDNESDESSKATATVYRDDVADDVWADKNWAKIEDVASSIGADVDELREAGKSNNVMARVWALESIEGHYGPHELDDYPLQLTRSELKKRWSRVKMPR